MKKAKAALKAWALKNDKGQFVFRDRHPAVYLLRKPAPGPTHANNAE